MVDYLRAMSATPSAGVTVNRSANGTTVSPIEPSKVADRGITVYIKCCLSDGSEVFAPLKVYGPLYATAGGADYQTLTPEAGDVPDNSTIIQ